jgi:N,N'-diacetyllegionaminate synthase
MENQIKIGPKIIDKNKPVYVIAEIGINHEGNVDICADMIKSAVTAGTDAIKLQTIDPDENYLKDTASYKLFKKAWLSPEDTEKMFIYARSLGVEPFTTVGDFKTLEWVNKLKPNVYKVSSGLITHIPLIHKIANLNKTVIISKGTANEKEVETAVKYFIQTGNKSLIIMHCVSSYPTSFDQTNLSLITQMNNKYSFPIGYSDHALGYQAVLAATVLGSCIIEKHFTLDSTRKSFDHGISLDAKTFKSMIDDIKLYKQMIVYKKDWISPEEVENKKWMRRILIAKNNLPIDHKVQENDIMFMRPTIGTKGLKPIEFYKIIGKVVKKEIMKNTPIKFDSLHDK